MKNTLSAILFLSWFLSGQGQGHKIETLRNEFSLLSLQNREILDKYDSLVSKRDQLHGFLQNEIEVYLSCESAYNDKIIFLERRGDRQQKSLLDEFNMLQLEYDGLESKLVLNIRDFNYWNDIASTEIKNRYKDWVLPEMNKIHVSNKELNNYVKRIEELQDEATELLVQYDSCRLTCLVNCNCESFMEEYRQRARLAESYMTRYNQLLSEQEVHNALRKGKYNDYRQSYNEYYTSYLQRKSTLDVLNQEIRKEQAKIRANLKDLEANVHSMILNEMENDLKAILKKDFETLSYMNEEIIKGIGDVQIYYELKELQRRSEIIVETLNPEIDITEIAKKVVTGNTSNTKKSGDGEKLRFISCQYLTLLDEFKSTIASYDSIPYFCLNAYPHYSNPVIDENMEIIEKRIAFSGNNLETRTEEFLKLEEVDLSNSNFSLDLLFKGHQNLQKLNLSNTRISSIKYLAGTNIQWLDLSNTEIDREDIEYIKTMNDIEYINLSNTGLKKKDIYDLCFYLRVKRKNCVAR